VRPRTTNLLLAKGRKGSAPVSRASQPGDVVVDELEAAGGVDVVAADGAERRALLVVAEIGRAKQISCLDAVAKLVVGGGSVEGSGSPSKGSERGSPETRSKAAGGPVRGASKSATDGSIRAASKSATDGSVRAASKSATDGSVRAASKSAGGGAEWARPEPSEGTPEPEGARGGPPVAVAVEKPGVAVGECHG
jgi:hypothetical protein